MSNAQQVANEIIARHASNKSLDVLRIEIRNAPDAHFRAGERAALLRLAADLMSGGLTNESLTRSDLAGRVRDRADGKGYDNPIGLTE